MEEILHLVSVKNITFKSCYNWFKFDILRLIRPLTVIFSHVQGHLNYRVLWNWFHLIEKCLVLPLLEWVKLQFFVIVRKLEGEMLKGFLRFEDPGSSAFPVLLWLNQSFFLYWVEPFPYLEILGRNQSKTILY